MGEGSNLSHLQNEVGAALKHTERVSWRGEARKHVERDPTGRFKRSKQLIQGKPSKSFQPIGSESNYTSEDLRHITEMLNDCY